MIGHKRLLEVLDYDPDTGIFKWKERVSNRITVGKEAGNKTLNGYMETRVLGHRFYLHRLAYFYMTGEMPSDDVDHINGDRTDNRWENLRPVSRQVNLQNRRGSNSRSSVGILGVARHGNRYRALIKMPSGKTKHIGLYETSEEAHQAYLKAKRRYHEGCTI